MRQLRMYRRLSSRVFARLMATSMSLLMGLTGFLGPLGTISSFAQQPAQDPKQATTKPQGQPAEKMEEEVVQLSTSLVQVPVTVVDKSGRPVRALKQESFKVFEDGVEQPITTFSKHSGAYQLKNGQGGEATPDATVVPYKFLIVFDSFHLFKEFSRARDAALKFVKDQKGPEAMAAVTSTETVATDPPVAFTADNNQLIADIQKIKQRAHHIYDGGLEMDEYSAFMIDRGDNTVVDDFVNKFLRANGGNPEPPISKADEPKKTEFEGEGHKATFVQATFVQGKPGSGGTGTGGGTTGGGTTGGGTTGGGTTGGGPSGGATGTGATGGTGMGRGGMGNSNDPFNSMNAANSPGRSSAVAQVKSIASQIVAEATLNTLRELDSLRQIMQSFSKVEGRKAMVLLSEGFYLDLGNRSAFPINERIQAIVDLASRTNTTIYTLDVRGLMALSPSSEISGRRAGNSVSRANASINESQNGLQLL